MIVAEEDLSEISFSDRHDIVARYCSRYNNVKTIRSGQFFASTLSFGDYFNRDACQEVKVDAALDCRFFSEVIAPTLDISFRMVGEEPEDSITAQYNVQLKDILPRYGIEVIEIPRLRQNGIPVSAKRARDFIKSCSFEQLKNEVPVDVWEYIVDRHRTCKAFGRKSISDPQ